MTYMTGDIPVIWRHFLLDISHIFYAKRVVDSIGHAITNISRDMIMSVHNEIDISGPRYNTDFFHNS